MKLILSPIASDHTTTVSIEGLVLTIDGTAIDLSIIPEGGQAEAEDDSPFIGVITREQATIKYFYDSLAAVPDQSTDWADYTFEIESGEVPSPIIWKSEEIREENE
jgi:hypothetical protein